MTDDVERIAKGLTKAQVNGLMTNSIRSGFTVFRLVEKGLMRWQRIDDMRNDRALTPLGLAVRQYLERNS